MSKKRNRSRQAKSVAVANPRMASNVDADFQDVAVATCFRAEARDFAPGGELNDWLEAEREVRAESVEQT